MSQSNLADYLRRKPTVPFVNDDLDELFEDAVNIVCQYKRANASLLQRRLSLGYARASKVLDQLHALGVVSEHDGSKPREVLISSPDEVFKKAKIKRKEIDIFEDLQYTRPDPSIIEKINNTLWKYSLYDLTNDNSFIDSEEISIPLGYDQENNLQLKSLRDFNHLLITGNVPSNKEAYLDTILTSLILRQSPESLRLILIDTNYSLNLYDGLPHLLSPVISEPERSISALRWLLIEMERRYKHFKDAKVRDLKSCNEAVEKFPHVLMIINQFNDIYNFSPVEFEDSVYRLTSLGHRAGIHLFITTNRLTTREIPVSVQSNITNKMFFRLTKSYDAGQYKEKDMEKLGLGEVIMHLSFDNKSTKMDSIYTSEENIKRVVDNMTQK